ncbi:hypothetical protein ACFU5O_21135 [Streptomyces sp. NPDC057445]|uniref:hypothetical protein n=1 Tax=Streptomyces sp. NPDC057445 TaxID=3346136 RepID=UPI0036BB1970
MDWSGKVWGATASEREAVHPCDRLVPVKAERWTRAVDVTAPDWLVFRWIRQLTVAPYSYDWIDFRGRKSPEALIEDLPPLAAGQQFLPFTISGFENNRHITGRLPARSADRYGQMAVTYAVQPRSGGCRLVVRVTAESGTGLRHRLRRRLLAWGDLIMMRKQLLTLKKLAERDARSGTADPGPA